MQLGVVRSPAGARTLITSAGKRVMSSTYRIGRVQRQGRRRAVRGQYLLRPARVLSRTSVWLQLGSQHDIVRGGPVPGGGVTRPTGLGLAQSRLARAARALRATARTSIGITSARPARRGEILSLLERWTLLKGQIGGWKPA